MNDTPPQILAKMEEMIRQKTPSERLLMGCSMFDLSRQLVKSHILQKNPNAPSTYLRKELFLSFYGTDFAPIEQEKIIKCLTQSEK